MCGQENFRLPEYIYFTVGVRPLFIPPQLKSRAKVRAFYCYTSQGQGLKR